MTASTPIRDLFLDRQTYISINCFVSESSTYSLSLTSMGLDHDSCHVMEFVYVTKTCSAATLNMGLKLELRLLKQMVYIFNLHLLCAEYELVTFCATFDEII